MDTIVFGCQIALGVAALIALYRGVKGPNLSDRMVALDLILVLLAGAVALQAARARSELFAPLLIVVALMAFVGTILVARFIEWRDT